MFKCYADSLAPHHIFGDKRLEVRLTEMVEVLGNNFGKSIPAAFGERKGARRAYNFFNSERMEHFMLMDSERERLVEKIRLERPAVVLGIQDTTELVFTGKRSAPKLNALNYRTQKGFLAHNHCLFTPQGVGLGVFDQKLWARDPKTLGTKRAKRASRPFEDKESYRWLEQFDRFQDCFGSMGDTLFVDIGDQESDIQEVLQARRKENVHYIFRSRGDRKLETEDKTIRQHLAQCPVRQVFEVEAGAQQGTLSRKAKVSLRYDRVWVKARMQHKRQVPAVEIGLVMVVEDNPPPDTKPIEWILSTSLPLESLEDALQVVQWYALRWRIEVFHFVLKQGCTVEKLQFEEPNALEVAIAFYSLLAMQVTTLRYCAEKHPDQNMEITGFQTKQYKAAALFLNAKRGGKHDAHKAEPSVADFARVLAHLGGSLGQKNRPPGIKALWLGIRDLHIIADAFEIFSSA